MTSEQEVSHAAVGAEPSGGDGEAGTAGEAGEAGAGEADRGEVTGEARAEGKAEKEGKAGEAGAGGKAGAEGMRGGKAGAGEATHGDAERSRAEALAEAARRRSRRALGTTGWRGQGPQCQGILPALSGRETAALRTKKSYWSRKWRIAAS